MKRSAEIQLPELLSQVVAPLSLKYTLQVWIVAPELNERLTLSSSEIASIARSGCSTGASHLEEKIDRIHKSRKYSQPLQIELQMF